MRTVIEPQPSHAGASPMSAAFDWSSAFAAAVRTVRSTEAYASTTRPSVVRVSEIEATVCVLLTRATPDGDGAFIEAGAAPAWLASAAAIADSRRTAHAEAPPLDPVVHPGSSLLDAAAEAPPRAASVTVIVECPAAAFGESLADGRRGALTSR